MIPGANGTAGRFFGLVLILSLPFYALAVTGAALPFAPALPISALMACIPMIAALVLVARQSGAPAAGVLFKSTFNFRTIPSMWWVVAAVAIMPISFALTAGVVRLSGAALPPLLLLSASAVIPAFALFLLGAVAEEIGWQGYAYPALVPRSSPLRAALIIGVAWALWHVIPFAILGRTAEWIMWHSLGMILMRIIIVWLFVNTGQSVAVAVLFHIMSNSVWGMFADFTAYYDPMIMSFVLGVPVIVIVSLWGSGMLKRFRYD